MILKKFTVLISSLLFLYSPVALSAENRGIKLHVQRLALVIGNSAYQTAPLKNPLNDAEDMAVNLKNLGFEIIIKKNADQRTMEDTIRYFGKQLRNGGVGLFYFTGHGMQVNGRNYLIPIDAKIESEADKPEIPPERVSETQVAAISDDDKRNIEPWTGIWSVAGDIYTIGQWAMKQTNKTVVSTRDSLYELSGMVRGNQLKGTVLGDTGYYPFIITISSDGRSFEGTIKSVRPGHLKGKRKE